ncbi:hypothetical protein AZA_68118 [Nitrospirillum viridazoti Y2]|nr:hypothetical protein AZA_68118 [Nitrospirillum amazonense Y2]
MNSRGGRDHAAVRQRGQGAADIVVGGRGHEVHLPADGHRHRSHRQAGDTDVHHHAAIARGHATRNQGARDLSRHPVGGGGQASGHYATGQLRRLRHHQGVAAQCQNSIGLAVAAGDRQRAAQRDGGAGVGHRVSGGVDGVVQQQGAAGQDHVAAAAQQSRTARHAGQRADHAP